MDPDALIDAARPVLGGRTTAAFLLVEQRPGRPPTGWMRAITSEVRARKAARRAAAQDRGRTVTVVGRDERDDGTVLWTIWGPAGDPQPLALAIQEAPAGAGHYGAADALRSRAA